MSPSGTRPDGRPMLIVALGASIGIIVGSVAPWVRFLGVGTSGMEGDGPIVLALGVIAATVTAVLLVRGRPARRHLEWTAPVAGALCLPFAFYNIAQTADRQEDFDGIRIGPSPGWGLWLLLLAALTLCITGSIAAIRIGAHAQT